MTVRVAIWCLLWLDWCMSSHQGRHMEESHSTVTMVEVEVTSISLDT
jgi:hypothetical protein